MRVLRKLGLCLLLAVMGCGAGQAAGVRPMVAEGRRPEARELPVDAALEPLPEGTPSEPSEQYVEPVEVGQCVLDDGTVMGDLPCPGVSGLLVSEARAMRDATYRIRYRELRTTYEADRQVWAAHRELYEAQIVADREEIARLRPSWWERHDMEIGVALGVVIGAVVTVAITFAVNQASE